MEVGFCRVLDFVAGFDGHSGGCIQHLLRVLEGLVGFDVLLPVVIKPGLVRVQGLSLGPEYSRARNH